MKKNQFLKKSAFALLGLFVLVAVSACTTNNNDTPNDSANDSQGEVVDNGDNLDEEIVQVKTPLVDNNWLWSETVKGDEKVEPKQKEAFVIMFQEDMKVNGTTDCNNYFGNYQASEEGEVSFGPLASTMMYCEDSQEGDFVKDLSEVEAYNISEDGEILSLDLRDDAGTMKFEKTDLNGEEDEA